MARRSTELPKGVWFASKRLATGERVRYGYFGRGPGNASLGREGSPEFHAALAEALSRAPKAGTVAELICAYRTSKAFLKLAPLTQGDYLRHLDRIRAQFGVLTLAAVARPRMAELIERWRDSLDASPRQADYAATVLKLLLAWGVKKGRLTHNRAAGLEKLYTADRSEKTWSEADVWALAVSAPEPVRRALIVALEVGASQGDLLTLPWSAVKGDVVVGRRSKTGVPFAVPVSPLLQAALDASPRGTATTILTKADGLPWDHKGNGLRAAWREACAVAGVEGRTFNDLRGTFISRRRAAGWGAEAVALCSGHPVAGERGAQRSYVDRVSVALANAHRLHADHYRQDQGVNGNCKPAGKPASATGS